MALPHGVMGRLQCVTVVFPDHTHLVFLKLVVTFNLGLEVRCE